MTGLHAGTCECGQPIIRRTLSGVAPKRCEQCRRRTSSKGSGRVGSNTRNNPGNGPSIRMRNWMRDTRTTLEQSGAGSPHELMRECAAEAVASAIGIPNDLADSILCAIEKLLEHGENGVQIRRRLNSTAFGIKRAADSGVDIGLREAIMGFGGEHV